jgi:hypothetical protein
VTARRSRRDLPPAPAPPLVPLEPILRAARQIVIERFAPHDRCGPGPLVAPDHPTACLLCALIVAGGGAEHATARAITCVRDVVAAPGRPPWLVPLLAGGPEVNAGHRRAQALDTKLGALVALDAALETLNDPDPLEKAPC